MQELLDKCHPLGMFDSISTLAVASNMRELYRLVLVDTPLAPYFAESLTSGQHRVARGVGLPGHPSWSLFLGTSLTCCLAHVCRLLSRGWLMVLLH